MERQVGKALADAHAWQFNFQVGDPFGDRLVERSRADAAAMFGNAPAND